MDTIHITNAYKQEWHVNHELVWFHCGNLFVYCVCTVTLSLLTTCFCQRPWQQAALLPSWCSCGRWWQQRRAGQGGMASKNGRAILMCNCEILQICSSTLQFDSTSTKDHVAIWWVSLDTARTSRMWGFGVHGQNLKQVKCRRENVVTKKSERRLHVSIVLIAFKKYTWIHRFL